VEQPVHRVVSVSSRTLSLASAARAAAWAARRRWQARLGVALREFQFLTPANHPATAGVVIRWGLRL